MGHPGGYGGYGMAPPGGYYGGAHQGGGFGPVHYAVNGNAAMGDNISVELRRRAVDALNEFLGDAKRRAFDANNYTDVSQRLVGLQNLPANLGFGSGYTGGYNSGGYAGAVSDYGSGMGMGMGMGMGVGSGAGGHAPMTQSSYLPLPNMRTKNDLMNIDQFLEQLQHTVYENSNQAAAAGVTQAGNHYIHTGVNYRNSDSPPGLQHQNANGSLMAPANGMHNSSMSTVSSLDTPALTPASSVLSYTSGHSPSSSHSPASRQNNANAGASNSNNNSSSLNTTYPTLPSVNSLSDASGGYGNNFTSAPSSALGAQFDYDGRRRFSGGLLQATRRNAEDEMDTDDTTPTASPRGSGARARIPSHSRQSASNIDPSLGGISSTRSPSTEGETVAEKRQEEWVENIRVIEKLREMVRHRLEHGEYEVSDDDEADVKHEDDVDDRKEKAGSLYPVLRAVQDH